MRAADEVDGVFGLQQDMDTDGFIALVNLLGKFHAKWHESTTEPVAVYGLPPYHAVNEMIRELCIDPNPHTNFRSY